MKREHCEMCNVDIDEQIVYPNITLTNDKLRVKFKIAVDRIEFIPDLGVGTPSSFLPILRDFDENPCNFCEKCWREFLDLLKGAWIITK